MDRSCQIAHQTSIHTGTSSYTYTYTYGTGSAGTAVGILHTTVAAHRSSVIVTVARVQVAAGAGVSTAVAKYSR